MSLYSTICKDPRNKSDKDLKFGVKKTLKMEKETLIAIAFFSVSLPQRRKPKTKMQEEMSR